MTRDQLRAAGHRVVVVGGCGEGEAWPSITWHWFPVRSQIGFPGMDPYPDCSVLAWLFRSVSDVVVGFTGLLASIIWMAGAAALLGPTGLGWVGPFGQVAVAVPVLLIGLGVDYSVHLTTRYREEQARGDSPARAASVSVHTVGVALVLATLATMGGFLANLATPLQPIADLGVFAPIGILAAFVILGLAVPATRVMLDERRLRRGTRAPVEAVATHGPTAVTARADTDGQAATGPADHGARPPGTPSRLADAGTHLATRRTKPVVIATLFVLLLAGASATRLGESAARARAGLATNLDNWADPAGAAARIDLPDTLDASRLVTADDDEALALPAELRDAITRRLPAGRSPAALAGASDPRDVIEEIRACLREEFVSCRPAGLSDEALARLAALEPQQVAASLADYGVPIVARTGAGRSRASAQSDDIHALAGGVRDAGGEVTVTSRALVNTEIVDRMSAPSCWRSSSACSLRRDCWSSRRGCPTAVSCWA